MSKPPPVRIGVLGTRRGMAFAEAADQMPGRTVIAGFVGRNAKRAAYVKKRYPAARVYDRFEQMLDDPAVDAVVIANYADEHAPAAIAALEAGKHVLSEVPATGTIAQGVALARAVERSGKVYFFGENFCYMAFVQEMRRLYESGALGEVRYAEGEYVHWARDVIHLLVDLDIKDHWRLWIPPTFYCTHSVGPILRITGLRPVAVQAAVGELVIDPTGKKPTWQQPAMEVVRLSNGALVKSLHGGPYPREPWQPWFSVGGSKGCVESNRWPRPDRVTRFLDGDRRPRTYQARFKRHAKQAGKTQHWGADFFTLHEFVESVRTGKRPDIDVYMGLDMTLVGQLAWRSVLGGGRWMDIPDLRDEKVRKRWENDHFSCRPDTPKKFRLPNHSGLKDTLRPSPELLASIRAGQKRVPYDGSIYEDWGS